MSIIQRVPESFLAALGIRGTGENPRNLPDNVQPVVELGDYYSSRFWETVNGSTAGATNVGDQATMTVPAGESWRVHSITGAIVSISGAATVSCNLSFRPTGVGSAIRLAARSVALPAANDQMQLGALANGIILPPGSTINCGLEFDLGAVTGTLVVAACIERLTV